MAGTVAFSIVAAVAIFMVLPYFPVIIDETGCSVLSFADSDRRFVRIGILLSIFY